MQLAKKAEQISESLTLAISAKAKQMKAAGHDVVGFGAGQPGFDTPQYIVEAANQALAEGFTRYTPASGTLDLKKAVCEKFSRDNNLIYSPKNIIINCGAKHSLYNTFQAILNPGDQVLIPKPYWVSYPEIVKMADGQPVFVSTKEKDNFKMKMAVLKKAITARTKALILNSPSNPNGCVYDQQELEQIAEIAVANDLFIIADEIYEYFLYDDCQHTSIASFSSEIKERTIVINGMSKAYAMTGWRIGFAAGDSRIIKIMGNIQSHSTSNPNSIAQYASTVGLNETDKARQAVEGMVAEFDKRRQFMYNEINNSPKLSCFLPRGAFYLMMNISKIIGHKYQGQEISGSLSFAKHLLESEKVAVVPGIAFGADQFVRLSYAVSLDDIKKGLKRIKRFIDNLQ